MMNGPEFLQFPLAPLVGLIVDALISQLFNLLHVPDAADQFVIGINTTHVQASFPTP